MSARTLGCVRARMFSVESERVCELLHMAVGECEIQQGKKVRVYVCVCVCTQSHVLRVYNLQVHVGVSVFSSAWRIRAVGGVFQIILNIVL